MSNTENLQELIKDLNRFRTIASEILAESYPGIKKTKNNADALEAIKIITSIDVQLFSLENRLADLYKAKEQQAITNSVDGVPTYPRYKGPASDNGNCPPDEAVCASCSDETEITTI
jgi:hypothetical protein